MNLKIGLLKEKGVRLKNLFMVDTRIDLNSITVEQDKFSLDITFDNYHFPLDRVRTHSGRFTFLFLNNLVKLPFIDQEFIDSHKLDRRTFSDVSKYYPVILAVAYINDVSLDFVCNSYITLYKDRGEYVKCTNPDLFYNEDNLETATIVKSTNTLSFKNKNLSPFTLSKSFPDDRYRRYTIETKIISKTLIVTAV